MVNFPTGISDCDCHSPALLDLFISSEANICFIVAFHPLGNSDHVVASVSFDFPSVSLFIAQLMNILALIRTVFVIIWEMLHGSISLNSVLLLLVLNFVSSSRLELMSLNENVRSSLIHLLGFQQLVLYPKLIEIFFCLYQQKKFTTSKLKLKQVSNRLNMVLEVAKLACDDEYDDELFLWYGWPAKGV